MKVPRSGEEPVYPSTDTILLLLITTLIITTTTTYHVIVIITMINSRTPPFHDMVTQKD